MKVILAVMKQLKQLPRKSRNDLILLFVVVARARAASASAVWIVTCFCLFVCLFVFLSRRPSPIARPQLTTLIKALECHQVRTEWRIEMER